MAFSVGAAVIALDTGAEADAGVTAAAEDAVTAIAAVDATGLVLETTALVVVTTVIAAVDDAAGKLVETTTAGTAVIAGDVEVTAVNAAAEEGALETAGPETGVTTMGAAGSAELGMMTKSRNSSRDTFPSLFLSKKRNNSSTSSVLRSEPSASSATASSALDRKPSLFVSKVSNDWAMVAFDWPAPNCLATRAMSLTRVSFARPIAVGREESRPGALGAELVPPETAGAVDGAGEGADEDDGTTAGAGEGEGDRALAIVAGAGDGCARGGCSEDGGTGAEEEGGAAAEGAVERAGKTASRNSLQVNMRSLSVSRPWNILARSSGGSVTPRASNASRSSVTDTFPSRFESTARSTTSVVGLPAAVRVLLTTAGMYHSVRMNVKKSG